jgi:HK97 family phage prohead protease
MPSEKRTTIGVREQRVVQASTAAPVSLRKKGDAPSVVEGYGALFGQETVITTKDLRFREVIAPGAFRDSIAQDDIRVAFNHDANFIIGRTSAKTATVTETSTGLQYSAEPPDTSWARDLMTSIQRRDITGSSFQFEVAKDEDEEWDLTPMRQGLLPLRTIKRAKLFEVGPVAFPAYDTTTVSARAIERVSVARAQIGAVETAAAAGRVSRDLEQIKAELRCCMDSYSTQQTSWMDICRYACRRAIMESAWCVSVCAAMANDPTAGAAAAACLAACRTTLDACAACITACAAGDEAAATSAAAACQAACEACAPLCSACALVCATMPQSQDAMDCMSECQDCSRACTACIAACASRGTTEGARGAEAAEQREAAPTPAPPADEARTAPRVDLADFRRHLASLEAGCQ